jgi:hypothetical protein
VGERVHCRSFGVCAGSPVAASRTQAGRDGESQQAHRHPVPRHSRKLRSNLEFAVTSSENPRARRMSLGPTRLGPRLALQPSSRLPSRSAESNAPECLAWTPVSHRPSHGQPQPPCARRLTAFSTAAHPPARGKVTVTGHASTVPHRASPVHEFHRLRVGQPKSRVTKDSSRTFLRRRSGRPRAIRQNPKGRPQETELCSDDLLVHV